MESFETTVRNLHWRFRSFSSKMIFKCMQTQIELFELWVRLGLLRTAVLLDPEVLPEVAKLPNPSSYQRQKEDSKETRLGQNMNTIEKCREKQQTSFADLVDFQNLFKSHLFDCFIISSLRRISGSRLRAPAWKDSLVEGLHFLLENRSQRLRTTLSASVNQISAMLFGRNSWTFKTFCRLPTLSFKPRKFQSLILS